MLELNEGVAKGLGFQILRYTVNILLFSSANPQMILYLCSLVVAFYMFSGLKIICNRSSLAYIGELEAMIRS